MPQRLVHTQRQHRPKPVKSGSKPFGHGTEIAGHVPEIIGHDAETTGHALPKYAARTQRAGRGIKVPFPYSASASVAKLAELIHSPAPTRIGSPIGTVRGGLSDWRWRMYFVSAVGLAAGIGIMLLLRNVPLPPAIGLKARLAPLRDARIGWTLLTTYLGMAGNFLVYVYFSVVFDRVLVNAVVFGALLVVWGSSGTVTNIALSRMLDRTSPTKVMFVVLAVQAVDMAFLPWTSARRCGRPCWRLPCGVQRGGAFRGRSNTVSSTSRRCCSA
jgi:hypothetical protein